MYVERISHWGDAPFFARQKHRADYTFIIPRSVTPPPHKSLLRLCMSACSCAGSPAFALMIELRAHEAAQARFGLIVLEALARAGQRSAQMRDAIL